MAVERKLLQKVGDYTFDVSKIIFAAVVVDCAFKGITEDNIFVIVIGTLGVLLSFVIGIVFNKIGGL
ncbi:MAG: hypothetical protein FWF51_06465 [Chitinivibrionia bacterium]|nr:hypothetical protein [Chitinivibrionia bacterium]MCL1946779.1 hypothetical protein [Chitinivibrionia bacterium]